MQELIEKIIDKLKDWTFNADVIIPDGERINNRNLIASENAIEIVKQTAAEYGNGWIPCSERLPNQDQDGEFTYVLITCDSIADGVFVQSAEFYISKDGEPVFDALYHYERVLAWQPIPE